MTHQVIDMPGTHRAPAPSGAELVITVLDRPRPQGSKRPVRNKYTGRISTVESSKELPVWREAVKQAALDQVGQQMLDCPLAVSMTFTLPKPAGAPKTRRTWPMRIPDVSKLARSTEDALTAAGIWKDDARVVEYDRLAKVFPGEGVDALDVPGAVIRIRRLEGAV
jgi:crossover junction endodeoxyribonuclease RusA